ncbi:MAG: sigma-54-dependent Fis family transcriptional regulator [Deltaproteobacteria bacterium]|nr:sigma-54-dependent Fis family transcriptional regulator [Deltaproteobacteria bacterium]MBW2050650.1 sigma-54-dependent Fis family transcriptional regulator [Deltaproteobacteria bacterium]MBW2139456.1 sigma-54-dependent Fis family transcriptional regulator [Deltaproteobacteria bacterium]
MTRKLILIVDDESAHRLMLKAHLEEADFETLEAGTGEEAIDLAVSDTPDLILLDLRMPGMDGLEVLETLSDSGLPIPVIIMTAFGSIDSAVKALKMGAEDYLTKPLDTDELLLKIEKVLKLKDLEEIQSRREEELASKFDFKKLKGHSAPMLALKETLALVAPSEATVLILGESGSGKEVVARALHGNSPRRDKPFVAINCAALPETLLESELFGHEKGAFTGAHQRKIGRFELADKGVLFLDEIGELSLAIQAKLLRILEERTFERLGGTRSLKADVRLLTASNRDLEEEIEKGNFREDLYYRLNVVQITVPNLRERGPSEITCLAEHFLAESAVRNKRVIKGFRPRALKALTAHTWPGNVRELINAVERAVVLTRGDQIEFEDLPLAIQSESVKDRSDHSLAAGMTIREVEAELIQRTLEETGGNRTKSAAMLGITRQTLLNKIKEYNL